MTISTLAAKLKLDLVNALTLELETAKKISAGERTNSVSRGEFKYKRGSSFVYEFDDLTGFPPDEGTQITFTIKEKSHKGKYLGEVNSRFLFEIEEDLGGSIPVATVTSDPLFLLEKQISFLTSELPFENKISLSVLGIEKFQATTPIDVEEEFMDGLNTLQKESLRTASENSVTYIWGPPGTGKTTTTGSIVAALASAGQKVLLVSNTNLALDTALERCIDRFESVKDLPLGEMLRVGVLVKPELRGKYEHKVSLELVLEQESAPLRQQIEVASTELHENQNELGIIRSKADERSKYDTQAVAPERLKGELDKCIDQIMENRQRLDSLTSDLDSLKAEFKASSEISGVRRLFANNRKPKEIEKDLLKAQVAREKLLGIIQSSESAKGKLLNKLAIAESKQKEAVDWIKQNPEEPNQRERMLLLEELISKLKQDITTWQEEIGKLREKILNRAKVIGCTAFRPLLDKEISKMDFDCVVIDEASMLQLPLFYCISSLAHKKIIVAGDFRQLQPIVLLGSRSSYNNPAFGNEQELKELMRSNAFLKSGIIIQNRPKELVALRDQYRMRNEISDLISQTFYPEHSLQTMNDKRDKPTPWGNESFIWVDTSDLEPESSTVNGKSRRNITHALVTQKMIEQLSNDGWSFSSTAEKSFAVISPYAKQSALLESLASLSLESSSKGGISTVHRFQGNERDLIIIDLTKVSSHVEPALGSFLGCEDELAPENAMWNVAISRARQHVIVIADSKTLDMNPGALISRLIKEMGNKGKVLRGSDFLENYSSSSQGVYRKGGLAWYSGKSFYESFSRDLKGTTSKLFLASPFSTPEGTGRWLETFSHLKEKGVEIVFSTKPIFEKGEGTDAVNVHNDLESISTDLRLISKMHEKIAVIDEKIVWLGSLNILSHKNSSEIMIRIDSVDFARSIIKEYLGRRTTSKEKFQELKSSRMPGEPCPSPGCSGRIVKRPSGISKSGRRYPAFFGCSNFPRCNWGEDIK